jgi:hypothetical protein
MAGAELNCRPFTVGAGGTFPAGVVGWLGEAFFLGWKISNKTTPMTMTAMTPNIMYCVFWRALRRRRNSSLLRLLSDMFSSPWDSKIFDIIEQNRVINGMTDYRAVHSARHFYFSVQIHPTIGRVEIISY